MSPRAKCFVDSEKAQKVLPACFWNQPEVSPRTKVGWGEARLGGSDLEEHGRLSAVSGGDGALCGAEGRGVSEACAIWRVCCAHSPGVKLAFQMQAWGSPSDPLQCQMFSP